MGTDHGKNKVRTPLRKPKSLEQSSKTTVSDRQKRERSRVRSYVLKKLPDAKMRVNSQKKKAKDFPTR